MLFIECLNSNNKKVKGRYNNMKKIHTSIKDIRNYWGKVFRCGYCDLHYIMKGTTAQYYNSGVYGWNCDIYCDYSRDIAITTGYRNMAGSRIPDEIIRKYTEIAQEICKDWHKPWSEQEAELEQNRQAFFAELATL